MAMTLTSDDLLAISNVFDNRMAHAINTLVPPMVERAINTLVPSMIEQAINTLVPPMIERAINSLVPPMITLAVEVAIEDLKLMIAAGFADMDERFRDVYARLDAIEQNRLEGWSW